MLKGKSFHKCKTTTLTFCRNKAFTIHNSSLGFLLNTTFIPQRPVAEQRQLTNKWNEMGTDEPGISYA